MMIDLPEAATPTMTLSLPESARSDCAKAARSPAELEVVFADIVEQHQDLLVNYLTRLVGQRDRAEDLAQETFIRLFQHWETYREEGVVVAYLLRIATNLVRDEERRKKRWGLLWPIWSLGGRSPDGVQTEETPLEANPERQVLSAEERERVQTALDELELVHRAPLVLREIEGLSYLEIAKVLECQEGTVKSRLHRARAVLKEKLAPYWGETGVRP